MSRSKIRNLFIGITLLATTFAFSQSAETGSAFNKYMSPEAGINPLSGTVALEKQLTNLSVGQLSVGFNLKYSGNVFKEVQSRNDVAPGGVAGLGWSFGRAKIICDCKENSFLDDDNYYLQTADGSRYKIFEENSYKRMFGETVDNTNNEKWRIEGNPYWKVERIKDSTYLPTNGKYKWEYVLGWKITDTQGIVHIYGDLEDTNPLQAPIRNATEYDLFWAQYKDDNGTYNASYGLLGTAIGGEPLLYPTAWNLSKEVDLDSNTLVYSYEQIKEQLEGTFNDHRYWNSKNGYTKESYLKSVTASNGAYIKFTYENKGKDEFYGEVWDVQGENENIEDDENDMFIEKFSRRYLSKIETYGESNNFLGTISFCYTPLKIVTEGGVQNNYVKRLLSSIRFTNKRALEVDYENYEYYTDANAAMVKENEKTAYPLGALKRVKGKECGWVEYSYVYESMGKGHSEIVPLDTIFGQGVLEDGSSYIVGRKDGELKIYNRILGRWILAGGNIAKDIDRVSFGDIGWFLAVNQNKKAYIVQWNGVEWVDHNGENFSTTEYSSPLDFSDYKFQQIVAGPDYAIRYTIDDKAGWGYDDGYMQVEIFWSKWGGTRKWDIESIDDDNGDGFSVQAQKNHILFTFLNKKCITNCQGFKIYTFKNGNWEESKQTENGIDPDNSIILDNGRFVEVGESKKTFGYSKFRATHWNGHSWLFQKQYTFDNDGAYRAIDAAAQGDDYYAIRHHSKRYLTTFYWNGSLWEMPEKANQLLTSPGLSSKWKWSGYSGDDFYLTTHAHRKFKWIIPYTYNDARMRLNYHKTGQWATTNYGPLNKNTTAKEPITGTDWFIEKNCSYMAWIWNGFSWHEEYLESMIKGKKVYSLGGDMFAVSSGGSTTIYYKINDSFVSEFGTYLVKNKTIYEPVTDKEATYTYSFKPGQNSTKGSAFDAATNTPLMDEMKVTLPNGKGIVQKNLCPITNDNLKQENVAIGSVCSEKQWSLGQTKEKLMSWTETTYERYRNKDWPKLIYMDQVKKVTEVARGLKYVTENTYSPLNGMIATSIKTKGSKKTEEAYKYVADFESTVTDDLKVQNRLDVLSGSYSCIPNCDKGTIVAANAYGIAKLGDINRVVSTWKYTPKTKQTKSQIDQQIKEISTTGNTVNQNWQRQSYNSKYQNNQVLETEEGPRKTKVTSFIENKKYGKIYGTVANCGVDEGLMLSGESCNMSNWTNCDSINLSGYAIEKEDDEKYGRFSRKAVKLESSQSLIGTINQAKSGMYRFSAWVQSIDAKNVGLKLSINNSEKDNWILYSEKRGQWQMFDWEGPLASGKNTISLSTDASSEIRMQDIRILPADAIASALFWNSEWNKVQTKVDNRGVGSYVNFDDLGRESEFYSESIDGKVFLSSLKTYKDGICSVYANGSDQLSMLKFNGKSQILPNAGGKSTYVLSDLETTIEFNTLAPNDNIRYKLYKEGGAEPDKWQSPCCGVMAPLSLDFSDAKSWILLVDVSPFEQNIDTLNIRKNESDWIEYGNASGFALGSSPKYLDAEDSSRVIYKYKSKANLLYCANFTGNDWNISSSEIVHDDVSEYAVGKSDQNMFLSYISGEDIPEDADYLEYPQVFTSTGGSWSSLEMQEKSFRGKNLLMAFDASGNPNILFNKTSYLKDTLIGTEAGKIMNPDSALYSMAWNKGQNKWEYIGSTPQFDLDTFYINVNANGDTSISVGVGNIQSYETGVVSDMNTYASDFILGPNNKLYAAYIGESKFFEMDSVGSTPMLFIKRLYSVSESPTNKEIWAGPSQIQGTPQYQGDVLSWDGNLYNALLNVEQMKLASDGQSLYLAVSYELDDDTTSISANGLALTVFKGSFEQNVTVNGSYYTQYLRWTPLKDASISMTRSGATLAEEQSRVLYLTENDEFDFEVRNGTPYIMFRNSDNKDYLSVVKYSGNRWISVGNPCFASPSTNKGDADLGVSRKGNPFVVFKAKASKENASRKNRIVAMHYETKNALDLTLTSFISENTALNKTCAFRQYILNYGADVDDLDSFVFKAVPKTTADVKRIDVFVNDKFVQSKTDFETDFNVSLTSGLNQVEVRIVGTNYSSLSYNFNLYKKIASDPGLWTVGLLATSAIKAVSPTQIEIALSSPTAEKADVLSFDVHFTSGWTFVFQDTSYTEATRITVRTDDLPLSGIIYNNKGDTIIVTIKNPKTDVDPTTQPWFISSSSSSSSSSSVVNNQMSTNVPDVVRNVSTALIFVKNKISIADNVSVKGGLFAGNSIEIGVASTVEKSVYSGGSIYLRNRANVQDIFYVTNLDLQDGATYVSKTQLNSLSIPAIPSFSISADGEDVFVEPSQIKTMSSGNYKSFTARANTTVSFAAGDYYFTSFEVDPDSKLTFAKGTRLWINGTLRIGDRDIIAHSGGIGDLFIYCSTGNSIYIGTNVQMEAVLVAPNAEVNFAPYVNFKGFVQASSFNVQPNSILE